MVFWCPQCQLPLTPEECADDHCALCGAALPPNPASAAENVPPPEVKPYEVPPSLLGRWQVWAATGLLLFLLLGGAVLIATWPEHSKADNRQANNDDHKEAKAAPPPAESEPPPTTLMGPPEELKGPPPLFGPPAELKPTPVVAAKPSPLFGPPAELKRPVVVNVKPGFVGPPDNLKRAGVVNETMLNDPNGEYVVGALLNDKKLKLTGKVKRLRLSGQIAGRVTLDASQLDAQEIIVEQAIHNEATVKLNAPRGTVEFRGQVTGRVNLSVNAPEGSVTFKANGAPILNESKIAVTAGSIDFQDRIQGNAQVDATLTAGGRLKFKEISNGGKLRYKKADPKDPEVEIISGDVASQGELRPAPDAVAKRGKFIGPPADLRPPLRAAQNPRVSGTETHLDDPDGEFVVDSLLNGKTLKLTGKVRRLKIGQVNGRATLDASQLEAKEIVVTQGIFNDATVKLNAPGGSVEFRGQLNGRVKVFVTAPNGTVRFAANAAQITSEAKVTVTAGNVECGDLIHGSNTQLTATLTAGGELHLKEVANGAKVQYKKANSKDPDLKIEPGIIRDQAELRKNN